MKENFYAEKPRFNYRGRFALSYCERTGFGQLRSLHGAAQCRYLPDLLMYSKAARLRRRALKSEAEQKCSASKSYVRLVP